LIHYGQASLWKRKSSIREEKYGNDEYRKPPWWGERIEKEEGKMKGKRSIVRKGTKIGAAVGVITFLAFGIIPGFYFGSYSALVLMNHLVGGPLQASVLLRVVTAAGVILGLACMGFMSIVVGSILGTAGGYAVQALNEALKEKAPAEAETASVKAE
jgi:hypothetical protein